MGSKQPAEIIDAEFTVVRPAQAKTKKRPPEARHWTEAEWQYWLTLPWWKRYGPNWPLAISSGIIALLAVIRDHLN